MNLKIVYNDSAISRTQVKDTVYTEEVSNLYDAFREVIETRGNEWEIVEDVAQTLDIDLSNMNFIEEVSDLMLEKYFIEKYNGDWTKALNYWLDKVDTNGNRNIFFIEVDGEVIRG